MTLKQVIDDLAVRIQHTLSDDDIVRYINYAIYDVRRIAGNYEIWEFDAAVGIKIYPLPTYVKPEGIKTVTANGVEYLPNLLNERQRGSMYYISPDGFIHFSPAPKGKIYIVYEGVDTLMTLEEVKKVEAELTEQEAEEYYYNQSIDVTEEYEQLIPLSVAAVAADILEDLQAANNYRAQYNALYGKAQQGKYMRRGKYPTTRVVQ